MLSDVLFWGVVGAMGLGVLAAAVRMFRRGAPAPEAKALVFELPLPERPSATGMQTTGRLWHRRGGRFALATDRDDDPITALWGASPNEIYAVGWDNIGVRIWDGTQWRKESTPARRLTGVWGNGTQVFAAGHRIYERTRDGRWTQVPVEGEAAGGIHALWGPRPDVVYGVGWHGTVLRRTVTGVWRPERTSSDEGLLSVGGLGPDAVWAVSQDGAILRRRRDTWTEEHRVDAILGAVWGAGNDVYVVGSGGLILHSTGDGRWREQESGTSSQLTGVWGKGPTEVYAYGLQSALLTSRGDGRWRPIRTNFAQQFRAVWSPEGSDDLVIAGEQFYEE